MKNHSGKFHVCPQCHTGGIRPQVALISCLSYPIWAGSPQESPFPKKKPSGASHHPPLENFQRRLGSTWNTEGQGTAWSPRGSDRTHFYQGTSSSLGFWRSGGGSRKCQEGCGAGSAPRSSSGDQQGSSSPAAGVPLGCDPPMDMGGFRI